MRHKLVVVLVAICAITIGTWWFSVYLQPILPPPYNSNLILIVPIIFAVLALLAGVNDALDLVGKFERTKNADKHAEEESLDVPQDKSAIILPPFHKLPQADYVRFIGREHEIAEISEMLRPYPHSQFAFISISGIGGIGKSALALEIALKYLYKYAELANDDRFDAIIWSTAKRTSLTTRGIFRQSYSVNPLDDIYKDIAITLEREDITRATNDQQKLVYQALSSQRTLLILDNLESIDDVEVEEFIRNIPAPTKVIVTTRVKIDAARQITLDRMPDEDALRLVTEMLSAKGKALDQAQQRQLAAKTSGVPLAIVWSVARFSIGYPIDRVLDDLASSSGDLAKYCFDSIVKEIREKYGDAHKLLLSLSLFAEDASRESLGLVANLPVVRRDDGLVVIERVSLVNRSRNRFSMLPLTRNYVADEALRFPDFMSSATERWAHHLVGLVRKSPGRYWIQDQQTILLEGENFSGLLAWSISNNDVQTLLRIVQYTVLYLQYTGRRKEASQLAIDGHLVASEHGESSLSAWLSVDAGWILSQDGEHRKAIGSILAGKNAYRRYKDPKGECFADCILAQAVRHGGDTGEANRLLLLAKDDAERLNYVEGEALVHYELGKVARESNNWPLAYLEFRHASVAVTNLVTGTYTDIFALAIQGNYGTAALKYHKYDEARTATFSVLETLQPWRQKNLASNFTARMYLQAADIEHISGNGSEAVRLAESALSIYESTRDQQGISKARSFIQSLN